MSTIEHVVPQVGPIEIKLYPPADGFYDRLNTEKEVNRLSKLRHLGALSFALEGARLARWDYTVALVYYASNLSVSKFNSKFSIGRIRFSSTKAALQLAALAWNIGHLPGTFSVEKGVYRYLSGNNPTHPASSLNWKFRTNDDVKFIIRKANDSLIKSDFYALSKVLAILKLLSWCESENDELFSSIIDFLAPLFLDYDYGYSKQWPKIREGFKLIRHVSYLTLDAPFSGDNWIPSIPDFFGAQLRRYGSDIYSTSSKISEPLSPVELNIYERLYHCDKARTETAIYAAHVHKKLNNSSDPSAKIDKWLNSGLTRDLKLGRRYQHSQIDCLLSIKFRTHFSKLYDSIVKVERDLGSKDYCHSAVHKYHSWNSDTLIEPDEYIIDILKKGSFTSGDLGKLLVWIMDNFDDLNCGSDDFVGVAKKVEIEGAYKDAFKRSIKRLYDDIEVKFDSWPLNDFGIFPNIEIQDDKGSVWSAKGKMAEEITRHIVRDRSSRIEPHQVDLYKELSGINALRTHFRDGLKPNVNPRCRWLIFTCSVTFHRNGQSFMEFDGGLLKISTRSGSMTWYGLETKNGNENPVSSLKRRLRKNHIDGTVQSINTTHAYVEMEL